MKKKSAKTAAKVRIKILKDGPYEVTGLPLDKAIVVSGRGGIPEKWKKGQTLRHDKVYHLCRCGRSANKPFCDGTHHKVKFRGAETASRKPYAAQAVVYEGPGLALADAEALCAVGLFCHRAGDAWTLTEERSSDPKARATAIQEACDCPSGRLTAINKKTRRPIEPKLRKGISLVEDPYRKSSGPLWVKGGVPVKSSKGFTYEKRNRVTLCRCGRSSNKPFCDGSHQPFKDGDPRVK